MSASNPRSSTWSSGPGSSGSARAMPQAWNPARLAAAFTSAASRAGTAESLTPRDPPKSGRDRYRSYDPRMARRLDLHAWDGLPGTAERGRAWALVQGDCVEALERLPPHSVDVAFADPPYMLSNGGSTCQSGKRASVNKGGWDASRGIAQDHAFQARWLTAVRRVLKPSGTSWVFGTQHVIFSIGFAMQELGFHLLNTVTWYKPNACPNLACRFVTHSTEILLWACPTRARPLLHRFNYQAMKAGNGGEQMRDLWDVWEAPAAGDEQVV